MKLALSPDEEVVLLAKLAKYDDGDDDGNNALFAMMILTLSPEAEVVLLAKHQLARARAHPPPLLELFQFQVLPTTLLRHHQVG